MRNEKRIKDLENDIRAFKLNNVLCRDKIKLNNDLIKESKKRIEVLLKDD